jgi:hypothetical protein
MKERGMIFNGEMVRAILDGRKTQTRRPILWRQTPYTEVVMASDGMPWPWSEGCEHCRDIWHHCPFGNVGDRIWVRETFQFPLCLDEVNTTGVGEMAMAAGYKKPWAPTFYNSTGTFSDGWEGFETPPKVSYAGKLRPSSQMPRWASRITLEITGVRVERVRDLTDEDAASEGSPKLEHLPYNPQDPKKSRTWFRGVWSGIYGEESWSSNPWVWVIEFKVVSDE